jgi:uncharacterized membrane protein YccC
VDGAVARAEHGTTFCVSYPYCKPLPGDAIGCCRSCTLDALMLRHPHHLVQANWMDAASNPGAASPGAGFEEPAGGNGPGPDPTGSAEDPIFFALRTTVAALLALAAAAGYGTHHPWWAAMTVWLVAQPTRGLLLARSLARLAGTVSGAVAGAVILYSLEGRALPSLAALASWLALCAGLGSIFHHFRNYAFVLAGYTAAIVVLFGLGDGFFDPGLALDRVICTIVGIACSTVASLYGMPAGDARERAGCRQRSADPLTADIGALDRALDEGAAGSLSEGRQARRVRRPDVVLLGGVPSDFDLSSVLRAASRPVMALAIAVAIWRSTAWQAGAMMAMTAALFASLFSSHDQGKEVLVHVLIGSVLGALTGIVARLFVLPYAHGLLSTLLCIAPFLLLGAWLMRRPATVKMAIDFNMTFLLMAQPTAPPAGADVVLNEAAAILAGVLAVVATFWLILPARSPATPRMLARRALDIAPPASF